MATKNAKRRKQIAERRNGFRGAFLLDVFVADSRRDFHG